MVGWTPSLGHRDVPVSSTRESRQAKRRSAGRGPDERRAAVEFVVPVDRLGEREIVQFRVPCSRRSQDVSRSGLFDVKQPNQGESRRLHGKLIVLESDAWVAALVGSSNFSAPGLGLGGRGNLEVGLAIGVPRVAPPATTWSSWRCGRGNRDRASRVFGKSTDPEERVLPIPAALLQALGSSRSARGDRVRARGQTLARGVVGTYSRRTRAPRLRQLDAKQGAPARQSERSDRRAAVQRHAAVARGRRHRRPPDEPSAERHGPRAAASAPRSCARFRSTRSCGLWPQSAPCTRQWWRRCRGENGAWLERHTTARLTRISGSRRRGRSSIAPASFRRPWLASESVSNAPQQALRHFCGDSRARLGRRESGPS